MNKYSEKLTNIYSNLKKTEDYHEEYYCYDEELKLNTSIFSQKKYSN
jgi:hypothetical protein